MGIDPNNVVKFSIGKPWSTEVFKRNHTNVLYSKGNVGILRKEDEFIPGETKRVYRPEQTVNFMEALFEIGSMLLAGMEVHVTLCHTGESLREGKEVEAEEMDDSLVPLPDVSEGELVVIPSMEVVPHDEF